MDDALEEDTCRICAAPGEPNAPLFHPCKCSGTIRYIHQDCLATWLAHSKKTTCDVCKHKFSFTKVYDPNMPQRLPVALFMRRFTNQLITFGFLALRGALVATVWLALLPYSTVWMWRFYFWSGDILSWFVAGRPRPLGAPVKLPVNATVPSAGDAASSFRTSFHPILRTLSSDIFTGQIITSLIVLLFLSLFLLREWIFQNARGDEIGAEEPAEPVEDAAQGGEVAVHVERAPDPGFVEAARMQEAGEAAPLFAAPPEDDDEPPELMDGSDSESEGPPPLLDDGAGRIAPLPQLFNDERHGTIGVFGNGGEDDMRDGWQRIRSERETFGVDFEEQQRPATGPSGRDNQGVGSSDDEYGVFPALRELERRSMDEPLEHVARSASMEPVPRSSPPPLAESSSDLDSPVRPGPSSVGAYSQPASTDAAPNRPPYPSTVWTRGRKRKAFSPLASSPTESSDAQDKLASSRRPKSFLKHKRPRQGEPHSAEAAGHGPPVAGGSSLTLQQLLAGSVEDTIFGHDEEYADEYEETLSTPQSLAQEGNEGVAPAALARSASNRGSKRKRRVPSPLVPPRVSKKPKGKKSEPAANERGHEFLQNASASQAGIPPTGTIGKRKRDSDDEDVDSDERRATPGKRKSLRTHSAGGSKSSPSSSRRGSSTAVLKSASATARSGARTAKGKGKGRAPPPPRIFFSPEPDPSSPSPLMQRAPSISPAPVSPRRPALPPALPTPRRRTPWRSREDDVLEGSSSGAAAMFDSRRAAESPGRAYYRAPEDMDYFGDIDDVQADAREEEVADDAGEPMEDIIEGDAVDPDLLLPPARDLTANVANPVAVQQPQVDAWRFAQAQPPAAPPAGDEGRLVVENFDPVAQGAQVENAANDAPAEVPAREEEEREVVADDDMDGALEAVGMKGPIFQLFQNAALMICILDVTIAAAVWLPFILGKSAALLSLDPRRTLQLINVPIKLVRLVTDPVVDSVVAIVRYLIMLPLHVVPFVLALVFPVPIRALLHGVGLVLLRLAKKIFPSLAQSLSRKRTSFPLRSLMASVKSRLAERVQSVWTSPLLVINRAFDAHPTAEGGFATLGASVRHLKPRLKDSISLCKAEYRQLVETDSALNRAHAVAVGYVIVGVCLAVWMQSIKQQRMKGFMKGARTAVRQQMLVAKVAIFIVIELVLFPLGCGLVLDLCALPLFAEATVMRRVAFWLHAPITSTFIHWIIGTMFMYQFAILLDGCRKIMRPGAMWFIKDPQDPTFSPIQDILSRSAASQLRKLFISAAMYCVVVFGGLGSVVWFLRHFQMFHGFLPLRWDMREPLSEIPIDLLYVHTVLPITVKQLRLRRYIKEITTQLWKVMSRKLRLTSYMFGGRYHEEEVPSALGAIFFFGPQPPVALERDGTLYRVPANDHIVLVPRSRMIVPLDDNGEPRDQEARDRRDAQDAEAIRNGRNPEDEYTIVYLPPYFGRRVMVFIFLLWLLGVSGAVLFFAAPILTGRALFDVMLRRQVHDGYSFGLGFQVLAIGFYLGSVVYRDFQRRRNFSALRVLVFRAKRGVIWLAKMVWLVFAAEVVVPILLGIALELHVILPIRFILDPKETPTFHIAEDWAYGMVLAGILARLLRMRVPQPGIVQAMEAIRVNGWANPEVGRATREAIFPIFMGLVAVNVLPAICARAILRSGFLLQHEMSLYRMIYPLWIMAFTHTMLFIRFGRLVGMWVQAVRDREFLVELRLRNLENA